MNHHIRRLMFVSDASGFGGAEQYILSVSSCARRHGIDPVICWLQPSTDIRNPFASRSDIRTITIKPISGPLRFIPALWRELQRERPDGLLVNAAGRPCLWMANWLARVSGIPVAWVHQMVEGRDHRRMAPKWLGGRAEGPQLWRVPQAVRHFLAGAAADAVVAYNEADAELVVRWHRAPRDRLRIVPSGINPDVYRFDPTGRERLRSAWRVGESTGGSFLVGTAARLVEGKGIDVLIDAVAMLRGRGLDVEGVIAGHGRCCDAFLARAAQRNVQDHVWFVGQLDDMPAFHSALDVSVLASSTESFGLAITEAMACERPVITTPTAGGRQQVEHMKTGWLLQGFDAGELAEAIAALRADSGLRGSLGRAAREVAVGRFGIERTLQRLLAALRRVDVPDAATDRQFLRDTAGVR